MIIESYEPYHIGTKLNPNVNFDIFKDKMRKELKTKGFNVPEEQILPFRLEPPKILLGEKNGTNVELNVGAQALNSIGTEPEKVLEVFKEVIPILPTIGYNLDVSVTFYEIIATMIIKTEKNPANVIDKSCKIDLESLKEIDDDIGVTGIRIEKKSILKEEEGEDSISMLIEPRLISPTDRFFVRVLYRSIDREKIELFHNELENKVTKVIESLEGV